MFSLSIFLKWVGSSLMVLSTALPFVFARPVYAFSAVCIGQFAITSRFPNYTFVGSESLAMEPMFIILLVALMISFSMVRRVNFDFFPPFLLQGCLLVFASATNFEFFIGFEVVVLTTGIMMLREGGNPERLSAFFYFMVVTLVGSFPLLVFMANSENNGFYWGAAYIDLSLILCLLLPLLMKVPAFGLHKWLPKAHVESDVSGSIILAGVLMKMGAYGLMRYSQHFSVVYSKTLMGLFFLFVMVLGMTVAGVVTMRQNDMKAYVAHSSVLHVATALLVILHPYSGIVWGAATIGLCHAMIAGGLFMFAHYVYVVNNSRNIQLASVPANLRTLFYLFMIANAAIPVTLFSVAEMIMFGGLVSYGMMVIIFMYVVMNGILGAWLYLAMAQANDYKYTLPFENIMVALLWGFIMYMMMGYIF